MAHIVRDRFTHSLGDIYNCKEEEGKGRLLLLLRGMVEAVYNAFVTGVFYTGFLSMYGISIAGVGIVTFIPYIANCFSILSPRILGKFKRRKWILFGAKLYYYTVYIVATTLMPQFVTDPDARLAWFVILLFLAQSVYAVFSPGITTWFYNFYPKDNERRIRFIKYNHLIGTVFSSIVLFGCSMLTDAMEENAMKNQWIIFFRYVAFFFAFVDIILQSMAKEYPYAEVAKLQYKKVFTIPFQHKKFLLCMAVMFLWNYLNNLNNGIWNYHLLNHLHFSYSLINLAPMLGIGTLLCFIPVWQRVLQRYSWIKTFGIACLCFMPTEFIMFTLVPGTESAWLLATLIQQICNVGFNLACANILYLNLPQKETTACVSFYTIGCNAFAFLGMITGTAISGIGGGHAFLFLGMQIYGVQITTLMRAVALICLGLWLLIGWRQLTPEQDVAQIEHALNHHQIKTQKKTK